MKKLDNFINCLAVLANADFKMAETNDIYRTGIIGQFNLTFELAWKALQEIMRMHGIEEASTGSPRETLQLAYKIGFISDSEVWQWRTGLSARTSSHGPVFCRFHNNTPTLRLHKQP